jgi:hypothetical protein
MKPIALLEGFQRTFSFLDRGTTRKDKHWHNEIWQRNLLLLLLLLLVRLRLPPSLLINGFFLLHTSFPTGYVACNLDYIEIPFNFWDKTSVTRQKPTLYLQKIKQTAYMGNIRRNNDGKAILIIGQGGVYGCEASMIPYFLENRLQDDFENFILKHRPPFIPWNISGAHVRG